MRAVFALGLVLLGAMVSGCRSEARVGSETLRCGDDAGCPEGLRCLRHVCIVNSPPRLDPIAPRTVAQGVRFSVSTSGVDPDGDDFVMRWTQSDGIPLLTEALEGATVELTIDILGTFVFEVVGDDGYGVGPARSVTITVSNAAPTIDVPGAEIYATVGEEVSLSSVAADADSGQDLTVVWRQVIVGDEPVVGVGPGADATFVPVEVGVYTFEALVDDGFVTVASKLVRVIVQPADGAVYVHPAGVDDPGRACGATVGLPCADIGRAIEVAGEIGAGAVLIAASGTPYAGCLDVPAGLRVVGGFDPVSWTAPAAPEPRATRVRCSDPNGHAIAGGQSRVNAEPGERLACPSTIDGARDGRGQTVVQNLVLASGPDAAATATLWRTVRIRAGGAPLLCDLDVEARACDECISFGIVSLDASPRLEGVEIRPTREGFQSATGFVGAWFSGGEPVVLGTAATRTEADGFRGGVVLSAPARDGTLGFVFGATSFVLEGISVRGAPSPIEIGILAVGSVGRVVGSRIDLNAFGTLAQGAVWTADCAGDGDRWPWGADGICNNQSSLKGVPAGQTHELRIAANEIVLRGASGAAAVPCYVSGVRLSSPRQGGEIADNVIAVEDATTLGVGIHLDYPGWVDGATVVSGNQIEVQPGTEPLFCTQVNEYLGFPASGGVGVLSADGVDTVIAGNDVRVGAHGSMAVGLWIQSAVQAVVIDNPVRITPAVGSWPGARAWGALLEATVGNDESVFARNTVVVDAPVLEGAAVRVGRIKGTDPAPPQWRLENNFLDGGRALSAAAVELRLAAATTSHPRLVHNTLYAGRGLRGAAVQLLDGSTTHGALEYNILDAGDARGRRALFDTRKKGSPGATAHNRGQFGPSLGNLRPTHIVKTSRVGSKVGGGVTLYPTWAVAAGFVGSVFTIAGDGGLSEASEAFMFGRILSFWRGATVPWAVGTVDTTPAQAGGRLIVLQAATAGGLGQILPVLPQDDNGVAFDVTAAIAIAGQNAPDIDVVFIEPGDGQLGSVWRIDRASSNASPARQIAFAQRPQVLGVAPDGTRVMFNDGNAIVWEPDTLAMGTALVAASDVGEEPAELEALQIANFTGAAGAEEDFDLLMLVNRELRAYGRLASPSLAPVSIVPPACGVGAVRAVSSGGTGGGAVIVAGCEANVLELFQYDPDLEQLTRVGEPFDTGAPILDVDVEVRFAGAGELGTVLVALGGGDPRLVSWTVSDTFEVLVDTQAQKRLFADVARYSDAGAPVRILPATAPWDGVISDGEACLFVDRTTGDLHLDATDTVCIGEATDSTIGDDVDGQQRGSEPFDIGADEAVITP